VRDHEDMLRLADFDPVGKDVLDAGSGSGLVLVWIASQAARAHGLELVSWKVDDVCRYLQRLQGEIRERVIVRQGNASQMHYDDSSFDSSWRSRRSHIISTTGGSYEKPIEFFD
jgi:ubiquinone/menaquinone biosynthesis C-methylase UbiE